MNKPLIEEAFEFVSKQKEPVSFAKIWSYIVEAAGFQDLSEEELSAKAARFYTNLLLDGRFVNLGDNLWDLRIHHTFDKVHIDMQDVYSDDDEEEDEDEEEKAEEKEYNEAIEGKAESDEEDPIVNEEDRFEA